MPGYHYTHSFVNYSDFPSIETAEDAEIADLVIANAAS